MPLTAVNATQAPLTAKVPSNLPELLGPQLIGSYLNWGLLGILGNQVYIYYLCFPRDSRYIKALAQTLMISSDGWQWFIASWGRPSQIDNYYLAWFDICIMAGIISTTVQIFFAWRIWMLWRSLLLPGFLVTISLMQGSAGIATGIQVRRLPNLANVGTLFPVVSVWLGGSAAVDIMIAMTMTYLLTRERNKTKFHRSDYLLTRLMRLTIETGALTATVATVDVIVFNLFKHNNIHLCPAIVLGKLYTNTLMAVFNNRIFVHRHLPLPPGNAAIGRSGSEDYFATFRDAMSRTSSKSQANKAFRDTFEETDTISDMPLEQLARQKANKVTEAQDKYSAPMVLVERETYV
ncbi:hypothetical protein JB92DRAFT_1234911 [Gautieria morchelliformis]|nr:hypothetical protein JB92DRAFT_1234911 [Gautieria morchelliformis]